MLRKTLIGLALALALAVLAGAGIAAWQIHVRQPLRTGQVPLQNLRAPVRVDYDERGVPHLQAANEDDLYRALGYVHAQDRLFQMEMVRRLARGELSEILGPKLLDADRLFRTLGLRAHAEAYVARMPRDSAPSRALTAYLDGINQYQDSHPAPLEFAVLGIPKRPFVPEDTVAVSGYLAYSFAAAFNTEPVLTFVRDTLGPDYLRAFDLEWQPQGVLNAPAPTPTTAAGPAGDARRLAGALPDWDGLSRLAVAAREASELAGVPLFEGSNAWAISGARTTSGKPLLAGDPHIVYSTPAVWYEAHLKSPGFELYGHHQALNPVALLGHNARFGWSLTMFQNDDLDLVAEKPNPANPAQVWSRDRWVDLQVRTETIRVKGADPVVLTVRRSPHGPIINDAFKDRFGSAPVALWWAFLETENPVLEAFHELNRADTLAKGRAAAAKIHAPGLNVVWANADGDIAWWAAAKLPKRPPGVNPSFILDASRGEGEKRGFHDFSDNPQEENPARGYVVSANAQPSTGVRVPVAGYFNLPDRVRQLDRPLRDPARRWDTAAALALQMDDGNDWGPRMLAALMPVLRSLPQDAVGRQAMEQLARWNGRYALDSAGATVFNQMVFELTRAALADELGPVRFKALLYTRALDSMLPRLLADPASPWWDNTGTPARESRAQTVQAAWTATLTHLQAHLGAEPAGWAWGRVHTLTHGHPLGLQKPLDRIFNVGPFPVPGSHETPNNMTAIPAAAPWAVLYGPSTRRVVDFAHPEQARGINPVGQSGVWPDRHYDDQAARFAAGQSVPQWLSAADVAAHTAGTLTLSPAAATR